MISCRVLFHNQEGGRKLLVISGNDMPDIFIQASKAAEWFDVHGGSTEDPYDYDFAVVSDSVSL